MKVAVIHYWLVGMRGGERVVEQILECYPQADIFTHVLDPSNVSDRILSHQITESFIAKLPGARKHYKYYLGLMPRALEELDLSSYDLVISSESGPAKGVLVPPRALHVCYCHTPMRYLYDHYTQYRDSLGPLKRTYFSYLSHSLRQWDLSAAARIDTFIANSSFTASRIKRFWGRESSIVHPPVDLQTYSPGTEEPGDYYLAVSELVRYKRIDLAIDAFRDFGRRLIVVGDGDERAALTRDAPPNVEFRGRVSNDELKALYRKAKALVFPGEEDFGIVPVEAMASGLPVIAYGSGGALDSVQEGRSGLFFRDATVESLCDAVERFEMSTFDRHVVAARAQTFSQAAFREKFRAVVDDFQASRARPQPQAIGWNARPGAVRRGASEAI
ncbi:glycosyltransferase [Mangrovicoccus sp. HB161399]|uniref:glycosyltransferase n=1 Tax=Mangrovicoccus sp. HB161399 TaxID=2720392 RepID=UPI00155624B5|nr:glycosyltransferase [Mangrovicoccus sp. HB161399]